MSDLLIRIDMQIAILVKEFPPDVIGGTETQTRRMARELQTHTDHGVTVYTKAYPESEPQDVPFNIVRVPNWRINPFFSTLTFLLMVTVYLIRDRTHIDLLQCMMVYPNGFIGYLLNTIVAIPYFAWIRGGDYYFMKDHPVKRWMIRVVLRDTLVLVQTETIRHDVLSEFPQAELTVLGNGVDIPDQTADGNDIVYVGRLKEQKGVSVLIRALAEMDESLVIVGDGPRRQELENLAEKLGVDARFVGSIPPDDVPIYLRQGKVFVLPSVRGEGLPNAVLEAMAHGLPVVATDTGGVRDAIQAGETGYLVDPNEPALLQDRLEQLCSDPDLRHQMGNNAREYIIQSHSWGQIVTQLDNVYDRVLSD